MSVLVAAASKYGATQEIAEAIGRALSDDGLSENTRKREFASRCGREKAPWHVCSFHRLLRAIFALP
jgi:hypothetical protein